ncbi:hypothetical protein D3C79_661690 [compost metagenome]
MQHHRGQRHLASALQCFTQQRINFAAATIRAQVIRCIEVLQGDLAGSDEREDIDGLGRFGPGLADLFLADHHITTFLMLHTFDDVVLVDFLAGHLVDPFITHRLHAALVQPVEIHTLGAHCRVERDRDMHQAKTDRAFPDCPGHGVPPMVAGNGPAGSSARRHSVRKAGIAARALRFGSWRASGSHAADRQRSSATSLARKYRALT